MWRLHFLTLKSLQKLSPQHSVPLSKVKKKVKTGKQCCAFMQHSLWVKCVLRNNLQYYNLIGPYYILVIGPRNSTWFTSPFSLWEVWSGHETKVLLAHVHSITNKTLVKVLPLRCTEATVLGTIIFAPLTHTYPGRWAEWSAPVHTAVSPTIAWPPYPIVHQHPHLTM